MNKAYKVIWSKVKGCYVVVSELAKERGKNNSRGKHALLAGIVMATLLGGVSLPAGTVFAADPPADPPANDIHYVAVGVNKSEAIEARNNKGDPETSPVDPTANYDFPQTSTINFISIGAEASAWANGAVAMGFKTAARGEYSTALGTGSNAQSKGDIALGWKAYTSGFVDKEGKNTDPNKIAIGTESTALKENGISIGTKSKTWYHNAIAIGNEAETGNEGGVTSNDSIAIGNRAKIQGQKNVAIGSEVTVGTGSTSSGSSYVVAIGSESKAYDTDSVVIGGHSEVHENATVVGNRSKADMQSVALGSSVEAGKWSVAIGLKSKAKNHAIAMGMDSDVAGEYSIAIGEEAKTPLDKSVSIGYQAKAETQESLAIGDRAAVYGENITGSAVSTAIGSQAKVYGKNSIALGGSANVGDIWQKQMADGGTAIGSTSNAAYENATALGFHSIAYAKDAVTIGANTRADIDGGVALGSESNVGSYVDSKYGIAGKVGYDPLGTDANGTSTWKSTKAAVSVGNQQKDITRQIINVAAGTDNTDAVNVAQLKSLGRKAWNDLAEAKDELGGRIATNTGNITKLSTRVGTNERDIGRLKTDVSTNDTRIRYLYSNMPFRHFISVNEEGTNTTLPNYKNEGAKKAGSIAIGVNTTAYGEDAVALGGNLFAWGQSSVIVGESSDNYTGGVTAKEGQFDQSIILGSNNTIFAQSAENGGREDKIIGNMNRVEESHGTFVRGTGNMVYDAYNDEALTDEDKQKEQDFLDPIDGGDPKGLFQKGRSHVTVEGDGNMVAGSLYTQVSGVGNEVSNSQPDENGPSTPRVTYNIVTGNRNTVVDSSHNLIMGDNHELENVNGNIIIGSLQTKAKTTASNVTILGNDANVSVDGGVALGTGSVASTAAGVFGYDPATGEASATDNATWKSGNGAVSVGAKDKTRQITNLAAGKENTDAVNVAQLKALNTKVDNLPSIHYFSVKSDDSANPDGTNWKNDGASGENAIAIGKDAKAKTKASVVVGLNASSGGAATDGVAVGNTASVTGFGGVAIGRKSSAQGQETVAIGTGAKGVLNGTIAIGGYANADGVGAVSIGRGSSSKRLGVSVGVKSFSEELGVSVGTQSFSNLRSVAVGEEAKAESKYSVAVGDQTASYAEAGVTLGNKTRVYGDSSVAIGNEARVSGKPLTEAEYNALPDAEKSSYKVQEARYPNPADPMNPTIEKTYFKVFNAADWNAETHYNSIAIGTTSFVEAKEAIGIGAATWIHGDRGVALGYTATSGEKGTALGAGAQANANAGVALGEGAVADTAAEVAGYDPQTGKASTETTPTWKSVKGAVSVGTADATRQITNLAAGTADTDAVNVAQLKAVKTTVEAGDYVTVTQKTEDGKGTTYTVKGPNLTSVDTNLTVTDEEETVAGTTDKKKVGYKLQLSKTLTGLTSVSSDEFKVGNKTYINSQGLNANKQKITNVAKGTEDTDAVNFKQLSDVKTKVETNETNIGKLQAGFTVKDGGTGKADVTLGGDTNQEVTFKAAVDKTTEATADGSSLTSTVDTDRNVTYSLNMKQLKQDLGITDGPGGVMSSWKLKVKDEKTPQEIKNGEAVIFDVAAADKGLTVTREGKTIKYGIEGSKIDIANNQSITNLGKRIDNLDPIHYFSVKSDDSANPDGTNWKNDGASGENAIAIGKDAKAERESSVVIGLKASSGEAADDGVAVGSSASVTGFGGVAIGRESSAEGQETVAIGTGAKGVLNRTIAIGGYANADGFGAVAIGRDSSSKERGVALGNSSFSHAYSVGVGETAIAEAPFSVAVGDMTGSYAMGAVTLGNKTRAFGDSSVAIGNQARVSGKGITPEEYEALPEADQKLYRLYEAVYYNYDDPSKPIVDRKYFKVIDAYDWRAEKHYNSIAIGTTSFVEAKEAIGIGAATRIHGDRGVALGYAAVSGENGTALGAGAQAKANAGVALGEGAVADTAAEVAGYDPKTGEASTETTPTWKSVKGAVSVGTADKTRQITNLAAGTEDTDAVNVAQLKKVGEVIGKGLKFKGDDAGVVTKQLGDQLDIKGGATGNLSANNIGVVSDGSALNIKLAENIDLGANGSVQTGETKIDNTGLTVGGKTYVSAAGLNANNQKITNVAKGTADSDGVNVAQLNDAIAGTAKATTVKAKDANVTVTSGTNPAGGFEYTVGLGDKVTLGTAVNQVVVDGTSGKISAGDKVKIDGTTGDVQAGTVKVTGAGTVNSLTNRTWDIDNPSIVNGQAATEDQLKVVSDGVKSNKTNIETINTTIGKGLKFKGDDAGVVTKQLGDQLDIKGGATGNLSANNIGVVSDGSALNIKLAENIDLGANGSVQTGETKIDNTGLTVGGKTYVSIAGLNANNQKITNVKAGEVDSDAVNMAQLKAVNTKIDDAAKWTIQDSESTPGSKTIDATTPLVVQGADGVTAKVDTTKGLQLGLDKTELSNTINNGPVITNVEAKFKVGADSGTDKPVTADKTGTQTIKFTGDGNIIESKVTSDGVQYKVNETKLKDTLSNTFAKTDASNLTGDNVTQWREKLGVTDHALSQASAWKLQVNGGSERVIGKDDVVNFVAGSYTEVTATGNDVKIGLNDAAKEKLAKVDTLEGKIKANKVQVTGDDATGVKVADKKEADGSTTYKVSLGEKIKVGGVTMDGAGANRTITGLTNTGLDVAGFATSKRAATEEQLQAAMTQMSANAKATKVESGDENIVVSKTTEGQNENKYTVELNKNLNVDSLNAGGTTVNKDGISVQGADGKPGVTITKDGIDAGGQTIRNVKPGEKLDDAATVGQLKDLAGAAGNGLNELGNQIGRLDGRVNKVGAGAAALAALHPVDFDADDKLDVAAGWGHYKGRNAMALGAFYRPDERTMFSLGGTVGNGENMINAGITFKLDKRRGPIHAITSKVQLVQEVTQLKADNDELRKDNAELREQMKEINAKLEKLMAAK